MSRSGHVWRRTKHLLHRVREVGWGGCVLLVRAFLLLLLARTALASVPVRRVIAWKQRPLRRPAALDPDRLETQRVRWAVLVVTRYAPFDFVCFPQCLAASELLRARGIASRLHYGAARTQGKLVTHTWLEAGGEIVLGGEVADAFAILDTY